MTDLKMLTSQAQEAIHGLLAATSLKAESIIVVGCSTSEVTGQKIGSASNLDVANAIMDGLLPIVKENNLYLAVQCCEHLNRALVVESACASKHNWEPVSVVPHPKAGGSFATVAMERFKNPVVVENIIAHAGLDIGDTFIGMHLKSVVIPIRLPLKTIGQAHLTLAVTRPKLIGGERARYM